MYKKLHKSETRPHREPYSHKGSFFLCVPERGIMLTNLVYHIQRKNEKPTEQGISRFFCYRYHYLSVDARNILSSLLKIKKDIRFVYL